MTWAAPWAFLLALPVAWATWRGLRRPPAYGFGALSAATGTERSWRQRLLWLPPALRAAGLAALVFALARPQMKIGVVREEKRGIAIQLVLDLSSSMDEAFGLKDGPSTKLIAAKKVLQEFVLGNGGNLPGRPQDLMGLVTFARYADTVCPMTLNHRGLAAMIEDLRLGTRPNEDATAYGDATALAAARLQDLGKTDSGTESGLPPVRTKVIVLLTDGENNAGELLPLQAAALAKRWGIRIYTIMLEGSPSALSGLPAPSPAAPPSPAEQILHRMAEMTGGVFRHADDVDALTAVYREIDALEKSPVSTTRYTDVRELFAWCALPSLLLLALAEILGLLVWRSVP